MFIVLPNETDIKVGMLTASYHAVDAETGCTKHGCWLHQGNPVTREEGHAQTGVSLSSQKAGIRAKLHADDVKPETGILPRD